MYKIIPWSNTLDLSEFYTEAERRGFLNNSNEQMLVGSFKREKEWQVWILYFNDKAVGSVAAHSFPEMGDNCYRIAARTCVFTDLLPLHSLRTVNQITSHQHVTAQFLIPTCIEWAPKNSRLFITSNESEVGTQRLVHRIFGPAMEKSGQMKHVKNLEYRGHKQTVWEIYPEKFYEQLDRYPRWQKL